MAVFGWISPKYSLVKGPQDHQSPIDTTSGQPAERLSHAPGQSWQPLALRRDTLLGFAAFFAILFIAIEILYVFSESRHGVASTDERKHYLWTYGPTAILSIVAMLWARLEYRTRALAPYYQLARGPSSARKTVLLDYVSSHLLQAAWHAAGNRHFLVTLALLVTLLLRLLIVLSTGLLSLNQVDVSYRSKLRLLDSVQDHLQPTGDLATSVVQGNLYWDLPLPWGTTEQFAFQRFESTIEAESPVVSADVEAFHAWLDCEEANFTAYEWYFRSYYGDNNYKGILPVVWQNATLTSKSCMVEAITKDINLVDALGLNFWLNGSFSFGQFVQPWERRQAFANFFHIRCKGQEGPDSRRIYWQLTEVVSGPPYNKYPANATLKEGFNASSRVTVLRSSQKICRPRYAIENVNVQLNVSTKLHPIISMASESQPSQIHMIEPFDIADLIFNLTYNTATASEPAWAIYDSDDFPSVFLDRNSALAMTPKLSQNIDELFEPGVIDSVYHTFYNKLAAQIAAQALLSPTDSGISGSVSKLESRLIARVDVVRAMEVILAMLVFLPLAMVLLLPKRVVFPFDPSSMASTAAIITESGEFKASLFGLGESSLRSITERLWAFRYQSVFYESESERLLRIKVSGKTDQPGSKMFSESQIQRKGVAWWRPIYARARFRVALAFAMVCLFAVLETLVQISRKNNGLVDIAPDSYIHYSWTLLPATLMVSVGVACRSLDQVTKIFSPFTALRSGCPRHKAFGAILLDQPSGLALYNALRRRHWAVFSTSLALILASFLTIIVSGVYSSTIAPAKTPIQLYPLSWYNSTYDITLSQQLHGEGTVRSSLILLANMSYPASTFETLAFPTLTASASDSNNLRVSTTVEAQIPAVRAVLHCQSYHNATALGAATDHLFPNSTDPYYGQIIDVEAQVPVPTICEGLFSTSLGVNVPTAPLRAFGHAGSDDLVDYENWATCPLYNFFWGSTTRHQVEHIAALSCHEHLEVVEVQATFDYPSFTVNNQAPPRILTDTARYFSNTTLGTVYSEDIVVNGLSSRRPQPSNTDPEPLDSFFAALIDSRYGIPQEYLLDSAYDQDVIDAIKFQHSVIRAQQFATWINIPANSTSAHGFGERVFNATAINPNRLRLIADPVSARILEAVLGLIALSVLASCWFSNTKEVLPHKPCSIAGVASLLADCQHLCQIAQVAGDDGHAVRRSKGDEKGEQRWRMGWFERRSPGSEEASDTTQVFTIDLEELESSPRPKEAFVTKKAAADECSAKARSGRETKSQGDEIVRFPSLKADPLRALSNVVDGGHQQIMEDTERE